MHQSKINISSRNILAYYTTKRNMSEENCSVFEIEVEQLCGSGYKEEDNKDMQSHENQ